MVDGVFTRPWPIADIDVQLPRTEKSTMPNWLVTFAEVRYWQIAPCFFGGRLGQQRLCGVVATAHA